MNKFLFFVLNFLISSNLLFGISLLFLEYIILSIYPFKYDGEPFGLAIWIALFFILFVWFFKILIFILLSQLNRKDTYMGQFFERIKNVRQYKYKVVVYAWLSDFLGLFLAPMIQKFVFSIFTDNSSTYKAFFLSNIVSFFLWGGGVTLGYLSLIIWYQINKNLSKNSG